MKFAKAVAKNILGAVRFVLASVIFAVYMVITLIDIGCDYVWIGLCILTGVALHCLHKGVSNLADTVLTDLLIRVSRSWIKWVNPNGTEFERYIDTVMKEARGV